MPAGYDGTSRRRLGIEQPPTGEASPTLETPSRRTQLELSARIPIDFFDSIPTATDSNDRQNYFASDYERTEPQANRDELILQLPRIPTYVG